MASRLQETTFADGTDGVLSALETDGGVIVHDFLAPALLEQLRDDVRAAAADRQLGTLASHDMTKQFWGDRTMRFTRLAARSKAFLDVVAHPGFLDVADRLLLPNCNSYWMNTGQMMILAPGQGEQVLHRDADNWPWVNRPDGFEVTISAMFALEDFTAENGATRVVPGSHRWDDHARQPTPAEVVQAAMPAGSGLLYTGRVLHGGGANQTTEEWRWGMHLSYVLGWLTPEEALPLGAPWEVVQDRPEPVQQLLGWRSTTYSPGGGRLWTVDYEDVPVGLDLF